jgi:hypothetical protein
VKRDRSTSNPPPPLSSYSRVSKVVSRWLEQFQAGATAQPRFKIPFTEEDRAHSSASARASAAGRSASMITLRKIIAFTKRTQFAPGDRQGVEGESPSRERVANRCVGHREVSGEALAGESIGQPSSRESRFNPGCRCRIGRARQHGRTRYPEVRSNPAWSATLACAEAHCVGTGRSEA